MVVESPVDQRVQLLLDRSFGAARISQRPLDFVAPDAESNVGGHFSTKIATGQTTVLNAGDAIASLRWSPSNGYQYVLLGLRCYAQVATVFTTAQEVALDLVKVANFSAADAGAGSTTVTMGAQGKRSTSGMSNSQITELRAAGAVALTKASGSTEEANAIGWAALPIGNVVGASAAEDLLRIGPYSHPLILNPGEGWRVRIGVTQGAAGVLRFTFVPEWAEVPIF